jgi:hypothetical protein
MTKATMMRMTTRTRSEPTPRIAVVSVLRLHKTAPGFWPIVIDSQSAIPLGRQSVPRENHMLRPAVQFARVLEK